MVLHTTTSTCARAHHPSYIGSSMAMVENWNIEYIYSLQTNEWEWFREYHFFSVLSLSPHNGIRVRMQEIGHRNDEKRVQKNYDGLKDVSGSWVKCMKHDGNDNAMNCHCMLLASIEIARMHSMCAINFYSFVISRWQSSPQRLQFSYLFASRHHLLPEQ